MSSLLRKKGWLWNEKSQKQKSEVIELSDNGHKENKTHERRESSDTISGNTVKFSASKQKLILTLMLVNYAQGRQKYHIKGRQKTQLYVTDEEELDEYSIVHSFRRSNQF